MSFEKCRSSAKRKEEREEQEETKFEFLVIFTFLDYGIEELETHLQGKLH